MAEGGNSQTVFNIHMQGGGTVIAGDNRKKSEINVFQDADAANIEGKRAHYVTCGAGDVDKDAAGLAKEDANPTRQQRKVIQPEFDHKDLTWLVKGKIVLYKNMPLSKSAKTVFRGTQQVLPAHRRDIAIKVIQSEEKNLNELRLLMKLCHPNIVQLIDAIERPGDATDYIYIVMELCSQNLRTYVEETDFDFPKLFSFVQQITKGLVYLHKNDVTHRDLKPDNVLISLCKEFAKLSDFGLSKEIPDGQSKITVTTIGAGTDGYRAPETYKDVSRVSPSIDIFPFGLVTYFTFTKGKHPFGSNPYEWPVNIMKNQNCDLTKIPQFDETNAHKREQLIDLLRQTLQYNPSDRPTIKEIQQSAFITEQERENSKGDKMIGASERVTQSVIDPDTEHEVESHRKSSRNRDEPPRALDGKFEREFSLSIPDTERETVNAQKSSTEDSQISFFDIISTVYMIAIFIISIAFIVACFTGDHFSSIMSSIQNTIAYGALIVSLIVAISGVIFFRETSVQSHGSGPGRWIRIREIQEELKKPLEKIGLPRSSKLLQKLQKFRGSDDLDSLLQTAENELQVKRGKENESIRRVEEFISSAKSYSAEHLVTLADDHKKSNGYVRALILYRISNDLFESHDISPDDAVTRLSNLILDVSDAADPLIEDRGRSRNIGIKYGLEFMENLLNELRTVANVTPNHKALQEAWCLYLITFTCNLASLYQKSISLGRAGLSVLHKQFGVGASKHKYYGYLLNNLGDAHRFSGEYSDAKRYYVRAIEAKGKALDYKNESEKHEDVEESKSSLAKIK